MTGIIRLLRGRVPRVKSSVVFYSKEGAKKQMNFWLDQYEDAVIQIYPYPDDVELPEPKEEKPMGRWYQKCYQ